MPWRFARKRPGFEVRTPCMNWYTVPGRSRWTNLPAWFQNLPAKRPPVTKTIFSAFVAGPVGTC